MVICAEQSQQAMDLVGVRTTNSSDCRLRHWRPFPNNLPEAMGIVPDYRKLAVLYTDLWEPYTLVLLSKRHRAVGKETGQTAHIERFNNTLRQRCANVVRQTLSFSKDEHWHEVCIRLFIDHYNCQLERTAHLASV